MKPLKLTIPALVLLMLAGTGIAIIPKAYRWYLDLRYPASPKPAVGGTNWSHPAGSVGMAVKGAPDWTASEPPMTRSDADTKLKNPVATSPQSVEQGRKLFVTYCAPCHGPAGKGDGPVAKRALFPPPNLAVAASRRSEGFIYATIRNGGAVMPSFGHALAPNERWAIVNFLRSIAQAAPPAPATAPESTTSGTPASPGAAGEVTAAGLPKGDAAKGKAVFDHACSTCHTADSDQEIVGPGLKNLFNWPPHRGADGSQHDRHTVPMIRKQIVDGGGAMPPADGSVSGQALEDLLAYLQTL